MFDLAKDQLKADFRERVGCSRGCLVAALEYSLAQCLNRTMALQCDLTFMSAFANNM